MNVSRVHPIIYLLVTNHYATYKEIRDDYDVWEVLDLYEMCIVNIYNKNEIMKGDK